MSEVVVDTVGLAAKAAMFDKNANSHQSSQLSTSRLDIARPRFSKEEYGRPVAGSLSDIRGRKASVHIYKEILELCEIIHQNGTPCRDQPEVIGITFGNLFNIYTYVNDKVVGLLLRARKQNFVEFEGECLFQRRDDDVPIFLTKPIDEVRKIFKQKLAEMTGGVPSS